MVFCFLPTTCAAKTTPFPNPTFQDFSNFILATFNPNISLSTTLLILFSLINNPELLNLHARQQHPTAPRERRIPLSAWILALARGFESRLEDSFANQLFPDGQFLENSANRTLASKLSATASFLKLSPYKNGRFRKKIGQISQECIQPICFICPPNMSCTSVNCEHYHVSLATRQEDLSTVTLIEGSSTIDGIYTLTGIFIF